MKDPIKIHARQLEEMQRLLRERIAPVTDPLVPCQQDTAAVIYPNNYVSVARPLQQTHRTHFKTFCECKDWTSKWPEDRAWCLISDTQTRFYDHPYNFETTGY
mmetsp:Transcript_23614/g.54965  ORF Transcript_23614/g.54965 Transcript_23614/m.54965 type:complete len:103 (-) Transcript_23614:159-467(-)